MMNQFAPPPQPPPPTSTVMVNNPHTLPPTGTSNGGPNYRLPSVGGVHSTTPLDNSGIARSLGVRCAFPGQFASACLFAPKARYLRQPRGRTARSRERSLRAPGCPDRRPYKCPFSLDGTQAVHFRTGSEIGGSFLAGSEIRRFIFGRFRNLAHKSRN